MSGEKWKEGFGVWPSDISWGCSGVSWLCWPPKLASPWLSRQNHPLVSHLSSQSCDGTQSPAPRHSPWEVSCPAFVHRCAEEEMKRRGCCSRALEAVAIGTVSLSGSPGFICNPGLLSFLFLPFRIFARSPIWEVCQGQTPSSPGEHRVGVGGKCWMPESIVPAVLDGWGLRGRAWTRAERRKMQADGSPKALSLDESEGLGCIDPPLPRGVGEHPLTRPRQGNPKASLEPRGKARAGPFALSKGDGKGPSIRETGLQEPHGDLRNGAVGGHSRPHPHPPR